MKVLIYLSAVLLLTALLATSREVLFTESNGVQSSSGAHCPELEYPKAVNSVAPPGDPQLLFLLTAQYSNANLQDEGVEFFTARLKELAAASRGCW
jgi:hypothetical protein